MILHLLSSDQYFHENIVVVVVVVDFFIILVNLGYCWFSDKYGFTYHSFKFSIQIQSII